MTPTDKPKKGLLIIADGKGADGPPPLTSPEEPDDDEQSQGGSDERCEVCRFWNGDEQFCWRYPPHGTEWSQPQPSQWCGEFKPGQQHSSNDEAAQAQHAPQQAPNPYQAQAGAQQ